MDFISQNKWVQYTLYLISFALAQASSMWGQFFTLKYPNLGMFDAYKMAIPFAWIDWFFMSIAVKLGDQYKLVTPTQDTFILVIYQFVSILLINKFFLKQSLFRSDIFAFFMILIAFAISFNNLISKWLGLKIPKKPSDDAKKDASPKGQPSRQIQILKKLHTTDAQDLAHSPSVIPTQYNVKPLTQPEVKPAEQYPVNPNLLANS